MSRELDKKIAELKGEKFLDHFVVEFGVQTDPTPHYSTSIADAWPLFEEMPGARLIHDDSTEEGADWYYCRNEKDNLSIYGNTAPEAICNAYIKWKEK